ncbi:MAG TPA: PDZ domain-containing protein [Methanoculleus sp.]|nr:PDZ domain-containing protein [Methanoculleus sp.]
MNWLPIVLFFIALYLLIAGYIRSRGLWEERIAFYGPILAIKSKNVGFFDYFIKYSRFLRIYGTLGAAMVIVISVLISLLLLLSVQVTLQLQPEPTGIYEPQNILLLPGINEFIPSTFAVWFAFVLTIAIHEFGHGILCRVENIGVRSVGALIAVIPIGFFVEPDDEELEQTKGMPKVRMFGAGITNNIVVGFLCFGAMLLLVGAAVPVDDPIIHGVYQGFPADMAGIPQNSVILEVNGVPVDTREDVSAVLAGTRPGDSAVLLLDHEGSVQEHTVTLSEWPEEIDGRDSGFMGIYYFDAQAGQELLESLASPIGVLRLISVPFDTSVTGQYLRVLAFDTVETGYFDVPFPLFWEAVHLLFWSAWININVGIFNAIPMIPLDGGYIMKEGVTRFFSRRKMETLGGYVVAAISTTMLVMMISLVALPYLLHL